MARHAFIRLPLLLLSIISGCAAPPRPQAPYAGTVSQVEAAALGSEAFVPALLPEEEDLSGPHPPDFYLQIALERNPQILAAQRGVAAAAETIPQVTALPNPMVTDRFWPIAANSPQTASGRMPNALMLSQELPWISKLRVQGEVAEQETAIALAELAQTRLTVAEQVQLTYYDLYYYQQAIAITRENQRVVEQLVEIARITATTPRGSQADIYRAELEADRLRDQLITLERQLRMTQADMGSLLHASPEVTPLATVELDLPTTPVAVDRLYDIAVRCRPELQEQLHAIVREERRRELARLDYLPDLTVGFSWDWMTTSGAIAPSADGNDNIGFSVGASLPIWRDKLRAGVREAEHRAVQAARQYDATRDDTFRQIRRLIAQAESYEQQITLYQDAIIPRSQQTFDLSRSIYATGAVTFLDIVQDYRELLMVQMQRERLRADLGQTLAALERAIGCELARPSMAEEPFSPGDFRL